MSMMIKLVRNQYLRGVDGNAHFSCTCDETSVCVSKLLQLADSRAHLRHYCAAALL